MENASKALIMAGSILIALMTIGALMFMFDNISGVEKQKDQNAEIEAVLEFNRQFEAFDTVGLRGTDILTVVNKMANYNVSNDVDVQGYPEMTAEISFVSNGELEQKYMNWIEKVIEDEKILPSAELTKEEQTEFKRKYFRCTNVEYDNNTGRVISMSFKEIEIN